MRAAITILNDWMVRTVLSKRRMPCHTSPTIQSILQQACRDFSGHRPSEIKVAPDFGSRLIQIGDETKEITRTCRARINRPHRQAKTMPMVTRTVPER